MTEDPVLTFNLSQKNALLPSGKEQMILKLGPGARCLAVFPGKEDANRSQVAQGIMNALYQNVCIF